MSVSGTDYEESTAKKVGIAIGLVIEVILLVMILIDLPLMIMALHGD